LVEVSVPAKINLWLEVIRKREDGYHDLSSLMLPVGIYDTLELESCEGEGIHLECSNPAVPADASNLAWRAAEAFWGAVRVGGGVHIRIRKQIPVAAGLGGGSADAAAVLLALNRMHGNGLAPPRLVAMAHSLGADVPFFLYQRPALATGIGEQLDPVEGLPDYPLVMVKPPLEVSTRWVYESLKLTRGESRIRLRTLLARPWQLLEVMENDLESVTLTQYPALDQIKQWFIGKGAVGALMSGSGPTVFGVFRQRNEAAEIGVQAVQRWPECWVGVASTLGRAATRVD
jgi:4-diphosphocytidyl-2-C-methyl-D-erythritol kinase